MVIVSLLLDHFVRFHMGIRTASGGDASYGLFLTVGYSMQRVVVGLFNCTKAGRVVQPANWERRKIGEAKMTHSKFLGSLLKVVLTIAWWHLNVKQRKERAWLCASMLLVDFAKAATNATSVGNP